MIAAHAGGEAGPRPQPARRRGPHPRQAGAAATRSPAAEVPQPRYAEITDLDQLPDVGYPCVVKPATLSASQGVIRADDAVAAVAAAQRADAIACGGPLLVEEYVPGFEVAVEGLLRDGALEVLAVFDKPDPLVGPYFEETIYVTPSRFAPAGARGGRAASRSDAARRARSHAKARCTPSCASTDAVLRVIDVAARSIGGLCARALRFGAGISLEEVILRHAVGLPLDDLAREAAASGVMMLPIPRSGTLRAVDGQDEARAVAGIVGLEISIGPGRPVVALPEGNRYLGFLFARADTPEAVEAALRAAHAALAIVID